MSKDQMADSLKMITVHQQSIRKYALAQEAIDMIQVCEDYDDCKKLIGVCQVQEMNILG